MRESFKALLLETEREGMQDLINWLENETDFYQAPASTKFHGSVAGGLLEHSVAVCRDLMAYQADKLIQLLNELLPTQTDDKDTFDLDQLQEMN